MRKDTVRHIFAIVRVLSEAGTWLWYREIARRTRLHHKTVARLLENQLSMFVETQETEAPIRVNMVRLKPGADLDKVARFLSLKEKLGR